LRRFGKENLSWSIPYTLLLFYPRHKISYSCLFPPHCSLVPLWMLNASRHTHCCLNGQKKRERILARVPFTFRFNLPAITSLCEMHEFHDSVKKRACSFSGTFADDDSILNLGADSITLNDSRSCHCVTCRVFYPT